MFLYMEKKILITNAVNYHYEIIESIIVKCHEILKISKNVKIKIHLLIGNNINFKEYIGKKYPEIKFERLKSYDYYIFCTVYDIDYLRLDKKNSNKKYILHEITDRLKENPNVYFLTPLSKQNYFYTDILPFASRKTIFNTPIYIIQGNLNQNRRYLNLLIKILDNNYKHQFIIKYVGRGNLPKELQKYKNKIVLKNNLNFMDFHKQFLNAYCILPLISKKTHPQYYTTKLTSTINYARGYNLKCLIDKELQDIYELEDVEIYNDIDDISIGFAKTLDQFYKRI